MKDMPTVTTKDGVDIFYKDWGTGQPIVFSHGWPLSADDWDAQMLFFLGKGFRVVAREQLRRHVEAERLRGLEVDDQFVLGGGLHRQRRRRTAYWRI
jgi:non-heme chloroperoxidase